MYRSLFQLRLEGPYVAICARLANYRWLTACQIPQLWELSRLSRTPDELHDLRVLTIEVLSLSRIVAQIQWLFWMRMEE